MVDFSARILMYATVRSCTQCFSQSLLWCAKKLKKKNRHKLNSNRKRLLYSRSFLTSMVAWTLIAFQLARYASNVLTMQSQVYIRHLQMSYFASLVPNSIGLVRYRHVSLASIQIEPSSRLMRQLRNFSALNATTSRICGFASYVATLVAEDTSSATLLTTLRVHVTPTHWKLLHCASGTTKVTRTRTLLIARPLWSTTSTRLAPRVR